MFTFLDSRLPRRPLRAARLLRGALLVLPVLAIDFCPSRAAAQDKAVLSMARAQFQRGIELEQAGNYTTALEQFRDVGQVRMTPQVRFHIATCEEKLGRLVTALGGYQLAFADADKVGADFKTEVEAAVTRLEASIPKLLIERGVGAEAAEIQLDGVALGATSIGVPVPLDPGPHSVSAKAPGYLPFSQTVSIGQNEAKTVNISLSPEPVEVLPPRGPSSAGSVEKPNAKLIPYVVGGAGLASLIGSGVFFGLRQSAISDLESQCGPSRAACPSSAASEYSNLKVYNVAAQVTLGAGVLGVGAGVTLWLLQKRPTAAKAHGLLVLPSAPSSVAGVSCLGNF